MGATLSCNKIIVILSSQAVLLQTRSTQSTEMMIIEKMVLAVAVVKVLMTETNQ